jgi:fructooligosaccharide transport system substrate-binding protein
MLLSGSWTMADLSANYKDIDYGILPYPVSDTTKNLSHQRVVGISHVSNN